MKKIIFLILFCASNMMLFAQQNRDNHNRQSVPSAVQRSFQKDYPDYKHGNWDWHNNQWHTRYLDRDHGNRYVDVYYDRYGHRKLSQSDWDRNDLPAPVRERVRNRYHNENYKAYRIEKPGKGIYFQIRLGGNKIIYIDEGGREVRHY